MPQQYLQKASNTFVKGLITEAGELTFPEDASVDELNCDLERDGSRRRRLGIEYETGSTLSDITVTENDIVSTSTWVNVGNDAGVEYLVVQKSDSLFFYNKTGSSISTNRVDTTKTSGTPYVLDLSTYAKPTTTGAGTEPVATTSINGALIVVSNQINPFYIERDKTTGAFTVTEIDFKVRDFEWLGDTSDYYADSASNPPGVDRQYDTLNTGWVDTKGAAALVTYAASKTAYPPLTLPWYSGKSAAGAFNVADWEEIYTGTTLIANGHYILGLFSKARETASGITGVTNVTEDGRFSTVATYSGRVFYSGMVDSTDNNNSKIYFSQLLVSGFDELGKCHQQNDPTSEVTPDLLDTDGGAISIPEAYNIQKLHVFGPTLYVFAENGVWAVSGVDDVFRATEYSVSKLTEIGMAYPQAFVSASGRPYWWSPVGIHTLVSGELQSIVEQNISLPTIQSFWNDISSDVKSKTVGIYDTLENRVVWLYPNNDETSENKLSNMLFFDEALRAFFPWKVSDNSAGDYVVGASFYSGVGVGDVDFTVVDSSGDTVVDSMNQTVVVTASGREYTSSAVKYMVVDGATGKITFASFTGTDFMDWGDADYSSFVETGYSFLGDLTTKKNVPYVTNFFRVTETGWVTDGSGGYDMIRMSSCKVTHIWDFKDRPSSTPQQAYRMRPTPVVNPSSLATLGYNSTVVTTRLKLRGKGRSMRIKYASETGKDFHLLGYEIVGAKNPRF